MEEKSSGIPQKFLKLFFDASHSTEDLMAESWNKHSEYQSCESYP